MSQRAAVAACLVLAWAGAALAGEEEPAVGSVWVSKEACPFEGCSYGKWLVEKRTLVRRAPNLNSPIVATLEQGAHVDALTGEIHVSPGRARVRRQPPKAGAVLDPNADILILDYVGEGYSRVYQTGQFAQVKIARTKERCRSDPNPRYCWVEVLREPVCKWWARIEARDGQVKGWVLVDEGGVRPIDKFE